MESAGYSLLTVYVIRWVGDGWLTKGDEWLRREMGGSAPACYGSALGSNPDISQKYKMGDKSKGVANTLTSQKIYKKVSKEKLQKSK
jgi:hypothetical protein